MWIRFVYNNENGTRSLKTEYQPDMTKEQKREMLKYIAETFEDLLEDRYR